VEDKFINDNEELSSSERRTLRRKRRLRNQIAAYLTAVLLLAVIVAGVDLGIRSLVALYNVGNQPASASELENVPPDAEETPPEIPDDTEAEAENFYEPEEAYPEIVVSALDIVVESCISELSLEDKIAALFFITPEQLTGTAQVVRAGNTTKEKLLQYPIGGLIYFENNIQSSDQVKEMLKNTHDMSKYPIFLATDEEGGRVAAVANSGLTENVGPMFEIGMTGEADNAKNAGNTIGNYLKELGFNTNFAPVADVLNGNSVENLGNRSFGTDPAVVADMAAAFAEGSKEAGIFTTMKHFPGLGNTSSDTHDGMAIIESTLDEMRSFDFLPFNAGIRNGIDFVMMGHVSVPNITGDNTPASLSPYMVTEILRNELGYQGIIITDALNMGAIKEYYDSAEACLKALEAGVDMLLMPENFAEAYNAVLEAVQSGKISEERVNESLRRIYRVKYAGHVD